MHNQLLFDFNTNIADISIPKQLNNPFSSITPRIAKIAALEFKQFIETASSQWKHNFHTKKGKMFGVLVVKKDNGDYGYLGTISGKIPSNETCDRFVPSTFKVSDGDFFINKGMTELTQIGSQIKLSNNQSEIHSLTELRKDKSFALQQKLFKHYRFINQNGLEKNVLEIFEDSLHGNPPAAAGECAAPKLIQYAFKNNLKPIALAEFWWGYKPNKERSHKVFYPACKNKCRPILEFMLDDKALYNQANQE